MGELTGCCLPCLSVKDCCFRHLALVEALISRTGACEGLGFLGPLRRLAVVVQSHALLVSCMLAFGLVAD